jgi:colanic acid/amylovoran biosynthesis glycosyltransferase
LINVALILSSKPKYSETFIKELIKGLENSKRIKLKVFYGWEWNKWFGLYLLLMLFKSLFFPVRVYYNIRNLRLNDPKMRLIDALKNTVLNIPIITSLIKFDFIHFAFANLAVNNTHLSKHFGAKTSLSLRGYDITFFPINHMGCYKYVWNNIDYIQYNSEDLLKWAHKWGASPLIPATFISAAVNDEFILSTAKEFDSNNEVINVLTVGRFHWKKGIDTALYAIEECIKSGINIRYTLIGNGSDIEKIKYLIYALNIEDYVEILNPVPHSEVISLIDKSDLIIVPSVQEGCSNFVLESQARGKYCIVSNAEGMNQIVIDGITGKLIPRGDFIALKEAIIHFSNFSIEKRNEISNKAISRIEDEFKRSTQIEKWINFFSN